VPLAPLIVVTAISEWARRDPERVAVTSGTSSITFKELDERITRLASLVAERCTGLRPPSDWPQPILPVVVDRSVGSVVAFLALLRAGQPFCPVDPTTPTARIAEVLARIGSPNVALVGGRHLIHTLPPGIAAFGEDVPDYDTASVGATPPVAVNVQNRGFVIFTSGSTGRPKAVVRRWAVFDQNVLDTHEPRRAPEAATWQVAVPQPLHFSGCHRALTQIAWGNTVHLVDPSTMSSESLRNWFAEHAIQEVNLSDTLARSLTQGSTERHRLGSLAYVRMGSEASNWETVGLLRRIASPALAVGVGYASSEVSRCFVNIIEPDTPIGTGRVPLGRSVYPDGVRLEQIDGDSPLQQLVLTDPSAYGYLDDDALNAERFFTDEHGRTWWRSGDLAEVDDDGVWHHRGRVDDLVKINGLLVAPQEAERALRSIPGVATAVVLPHRSAAGHTRLVAHLVLDDSPEAAALTPRSVREALQDTLPRHLIPGILAKHDTLPFGERLKLDRTLLRSSPVPRWRSVPNRMTSDETTLWLMGRLVELLDLDDIWPDEDFWSLGLDSLDAVELCTMVADAGLGELEPPLLLSANTPALLAAEILKQRGNQAPEPSHVIVLNDQAPNDPVFLLPGGGGTSLAFRSLATELSDYPLVVVEPRALHHRTRVQRSVRSMAESAADEVRKRLAADRTCVIIGYSAGATIGHEVSQILTDEGRKVRLCFLDAAVRGRGLALDEPSGQPIETGPSLLRRWWSPVRAALVAVDRQFPYVPWRRTRFDKRHYLRFNAVIRRAVRHYRAEPLRVPLTVVETEGSGRGERCRAFANDLTVVQCGGDHFTMLQPPHVRGVAANVRRVIEG